MTARTRRFFNDRTAVVAEMLEGYTAANANVIALSDGMVIRAKRKADGLVGLVVANGSGHEPAMIGWVGQGLLDVNVPGPGSSSSGRSSERSRSGVRDWLTAPRWRCACATVRGRSPPRSGR